MWQTTQRFFSGKGIFHHPVYGNGPEEGEEWIENNIDKIIAETKDIEYRKNFDKYIPFQVTPVGISGFKKFWNAPFIRILKKIGKIFLRIIKQ